MRGRTQGERLTWSYQSDNTNKGAHLFIQGNLQIYKYAYMQTT